MQTDEGFVTYKILPQYDLIIEFLSGKVEGRHVVELLKKMQADKNYKPGYKVLIDLRHLNSAWEDASEKSLEDFVSFLKSNEHMLARKKVAYLFSNPVQAVLSTFLKHAYTELSIHAAIFTTLEACCVNLEIRSENIAFIDNLLMQIKNNRP